MRGEQSENEEREGGRMYKIQGEIETEIDRQIAIEREKDGQVDRGIERQTGRYIEKRWEERESQGQKVSDWPIPWTPFPAPQLLRFPQQCCQMVEMFRVLVEFLQLQGG